MNTENRIVRPTQYAKKLAVKNKLELGNLVIESGLSTEAKEIIIGAMLVAKNELKTNPGYRKYLHSLGQSEFIKSANKIL